jgi:predicted phosphoribosyltransferase
MFQDRADAGRQLASQLLHLKDKHPVVLALPRGGVPVGVEIAKALGAPLDLVLVRKIGAPWQPELAVAAVVDGEEPQTVRNLDVMLAMGLTDDFVEEEAKQQLKEIERRRQIYLGGRARVDVKGRTAILVDDGIATVHRAGPARLVLAVAVAPPETLDILRQEADEIVCLSPQAFFGGISTFYADFHQVGDEEVVDLLNRAADFLEEEAALPAP